MELIVEYKTIVWQRAVFECDAAQRDEILAFVEEQDLSFLGDEDLGFVENQIVYEVEDIWEDPQTLKIAVDIKQDGVEIYCSY